MGGFNHTISICDMYNVPMYRTIPESEKLKMHKSIFLALLLLVAARAVVSQDDCPNAATECPGNCAGEQCARFLNAECQENPCHSLCTPNFFEAIT